MAYHLRRRVTRPYPCPSEPTASHRQGSPGRRTSGGEETWSLGVERGRRGSGRRGGGLRAGRKRGVWASNGDGADQDGEEADGLGRLLGGEVYEVGLCQLDLLVHVITGRLSLTTSASGSASGPNLVDIVSGRTPHFLHAGGSRSRRCVKCHAAVPAEFPQSSRGVLEMQPACRGGVPPCANCWGRSCRSGWRCSRRRYHAPDHGIAAQLRSAGLQHVRSPEAIA
jgi:hypothetical protein